MDGAWARAINEHIRRTPLTRDLDHKKHISSIKNGKYNQPGTWGLSLIRWNQKQADFKHNQLDIKTKTPSTRKGPESSEPYTTESIQTNPNFSVFQASIEKPKYRKSYFSFLLSRRCVTQSRCVNYLQKRGGI